MVCVLTMNLYHGTQILLFLIYSRVHRHNWMGWCDTVWHFQSIAHMPRAGGSVSVLDACVSLSLGCDMEYVVLDTLVRYRAHRFQSRVMIILSETIILQILTTAIFLITYPRSFLQYSCLAPCPCSTRSAWFQAIVHILPLFIRFAYRLLWCDVKSAYIQH